MRKTTIISSRKRVCVLFASFLLTLIASPLPVFASDWEYTVRKGDTLWGLCKQYTKKADCWLKIGDFNKVEYPRSLAPGTRIKFPVEWLLAPPVAASVTYVKGQAKKMLPSEGLTQLKQGDTLPMGTRVFTGSAGLVLIQFADGSVMTLEQDSELSLDTLSRYQATGMVDTRVQLKKGAVQTRVPKRKPRSNFEVSTPSSVAAVRGTDFRVSSITGKQALTRNEVFSGAVAVTNTAEKKELTEQTGLVAVKDQPLPDPVKLLSAPSLPLAPGTYPAPFTLEWKKVDGALSYRLELTSDSEKPSTQNSNTEVNLHMTQANSFDLEDLADACYTMRVSAIDANQLQGMPSEARYCIQTQLKAPTEFHIERSKTGLHFSWQGLATASKYRVEFSEDKDFNEIIASEYVSEPTLLLNRDMHAAKYARVVALDEKVQSEASTVMKIPSGYLTDVVALLSWAIVVLLLI